MCGLWITDGTRSWYESGKVTDVTVRGNVYCGGDGAFIQVYSRYADPVRRNTAVTDNDLEFSYGNETILEACCIDDIAFCDNRLSGTGNECRLTFEDCGNVYVQGHLFAGKLTVINK